MTSNSKYVSSLVKSASHVTAKEFIQLVDNSIYQIDGEVERKSLQVLGRLAKMPLKGETIIVGDIHGDLGSLVHIIENSDFFRRNLKNEDLYMIFLGDYGDRGVFSPGVYYTTLKLKERFPDKVILMRGNHEGPDDLLADPHDLPYQLQERFGKNGLEAYAKMRELFNYLYSAVLIPERCILLHGGIPSQTNSVDDLAYAHKTHPNETYLEEILWNDPTDELEGTSPSPRGAGKLFGKDITERFLKLLNVRVLIRGHEPCGKGFKINHENKVLTLFSRKGAPYYNDFGAYLQINIPKKIENTAQLLPHVHRF